MLYEKQLLTKNNKMFLNIKDFFFKSLAFYHSRGTCLEERKKNNYGI